MMISKQGLNYQNSKLVQHLNLEALQFQLHHTLIPLSFLSFKFINYFVCIIFSDIQLPH